MSPAGFEPTFRARERPQTHVLDGEAAGIVVRLISVLGLFRLTPEIFRTSINEGWFTVIPNFALVTCLKLARYCDKTCDRSLLPQRTSLNIIQITKEMTIIQV